MLFFIEPHQVEEWREKNETSETRILKSLHFYRFLFIAPLDILRQTCPFNAKRCLDGVIIRKRNEKIAMEIESFHVETIKMFASEL